jgi:hypothetical protein
MNKNTLKSVIAKYGNIKDEAELKEALSKDDRQFDAEEIETIYNEILSFQENAIVANPVIDQNQEIDLSGIDYNDLTGESYQKYKAIENSLLLRQSYMFCWYKAVGIWEMEFDKKSGKSIPVMIGIKLISNIPINDCLSEYRHIKDANSQIMNRDNPPTNSRYYLLKK